MTQYSSVYHRHCLSSSGGLLLIFLSCQALAGGCHGNADATTTTTTTRAYQFYGEHQLSIMSYSEVDVQALAALLNPGDAAHQDDHHQHHHTNSITPGDLGKTSTKVRQPQHHPGHPDSDSAEALSTRHGEGAWDENREGEGGGGGGLSDPRPEPHYQVTFRERITPSQIYLPMSLGRVGEEDVVVSVELPGELLTEVTLEVTPNTLDLASPQYHLHLPLPRPVNQRKGVATWDPTTHTLVVTLPTDHSTTLLHPATH